MLSVKTNIVVVLENVRSAHNVGSILRTCDVFNVKTVYCCGITPYLPQQNDSRLPHVQAKALSLIAKTSLGAEKNVNTIHFNSTSEAILSLKDKMFTIYAIEQAKDSTPIEEFKPKIPCGLVLGSEVNGLAEDTIAKCDDILEITQFGKKESLNVSVAAGIALFELSH